MQGFDLGDIADRKGPIVLGFAQLDFLEELRRLLVFLGNLQGGGLGPT